MIRQSHFWVFVQKNWDQDLDEIAIFCDRCSVIHSSQDMETSQALSRAGADGERVWKHMQGNITQTWKRSRFYPM